MIPVMQISPHFSLAELCVTQTGLDNTPNAGQIGLLRILAAYLEKVRHILGDAPIVINSAHRSPEVNAADGGVNPSAHEEDYAADIVRPGMTCIEVAHALVAASKENPPRIKFDQLIYEVTWVHVSRDPRLRGMVLTHQSDGSYTVGIDEGATL